MTETLKKHASLRGTNVVSDEANQLTEFKRGQSTNLTTLTDFTALNRLGCRAHIRSLAMTQSVERTHGSISHNALSPYQPNALSPRGYAFTMAEILLSLTIIGVVAAITLPSLMANINERTWNTQRKALYARLSQAIGMMPHLDGYGTLTEDENGSVTADTAAETFLTEGLSKVLKINNICDADHLSDCGVPSQMADMNGSVVYSTFPKTLLEYNQYFSVDRWGTDSDFHYLYSQIDTKTAAFETLSGESIAVFYNPYCTSDRELGVSNNVYAQPFMCANFVYDLNGNKGPNTMGKDIGFLTALYSSGSSVVAPMPTALLNGRREDFETALQVCRVERDNARVPNIEEVMSVFYNQYLVGEEIYALWSSTRISSTHARILRGGYGSLGTHPLDGERTVLCVQR